MNKLTILMLIASLLPSAAISENVLESIDYHTSLNEKIKFDDEKFKQLVDNLSLTIQVTNGRFYYGDLNKEEEIRIKKSLLNIVNFIDPDYSEPEIAFNNKQEYILFKK